METVHKERLIEEAKQRSFEDIVDKAHHGSNAEDAVLLRDALLKVGIAEAGTLKGLIEKIFEKAMTDANARRTLSELCQIMPVQFEPVAVEVPKEKGAGSRSSSEKRIDFRVMLTKKCKDEIDAGAKAIKACKAWDDKECEGELKGDDKKAAEVDRKAHDRLLAAFDFCGILYNAGLVSEKIVHSCIDLVLKGDDDPQAEDLEALCNMLKRIGAKLDGGSHTSKEGKAVAAYFDRMQKIKENAVSTQVSTMLEEVMTLRSSGWAA